MSKTNWEKIEPVDAEMWDFEKDGAELVGKLVEVRYKVGPNDSNIYTVETESGEHRNFWGSTILDERLKSAELGDLVKVVYLGRAKSEKTGREYKNFDVFKARGTPKENVSPDDVPDFTDGEAEGF